VELIKNIIIEYLKHNKRLVVPKLGAFIVKQPGNKILFSELMRGEDSTLLSLLVAYGMSELEASGRINRLVFEVRNAVGRGESYTIEGFGVFTAGENNNIVFKQHREPITIGGNIRPPFDALQEAKRKLQRTPANGGAQRAEKPSVARSVAGGRTSAKMGGEETLNMSRPDSYLRGLRYENKKEKGRENDRKATKFSLNNRVALLAVLLLGVVATIFIIYYVWLRDDSGAPSPSATPSTVVEPAEVHSAEDLSIEPKRDSVAVDEGVPSVDTLKNEN
jgi:nucleoid DNA-binding protein